MCHGERLHDEAQYQPLIKPQQYSDAKAVAKGSTGCPSICRGVDHRYTERRVDIPHHRGQLEKLIESALSSHHITLAKDYTQLETRLTLLTLLLSA